MWTDFEANASGVCETLEALVAFVQVLDASWLR